MVSQEELKHISAGGCCCTIIITLISLIAGFGVVAPLEVGLRANYYYFTVDTETVVEPGRYWLGASSFYFIYPTTIQIIDFSSNESADRQSLRCWSRDGQLVYVDVSFFFQVKKDEVPNIFRKYESKWKESLIQVSRGAIKSTTTAFNTTDFFTDRITLKETLFQAVFDVLDPEGFTLLNLQLRKIDIPSSFETVIEDKLVSAQNATTELFRRNLTIIEADTRVIQETAQQEVNKWKARAIGDVSIVESKASADGLKTVLLAKADSYSNFSATFDFSAEQLLDYVYTSKISDKSKVKLVVGFPKPTFSVSENAASYVSAVQTIVTSASADNISGSFTLSLGGYTTASPVAYNASPGDVKTALETLESVGVVSVTRDSSENNGYVWSVTFHTNTGPLPDMVIDSTSLTGTEVNAEVATVIGGVGPTNNVYNWK